MRTVVAIAAFAAAFGLSACNSPADKAAETKADALEAQAAATPDEAKEKALNDQADMIEQKAGDADSGATTANTPTTDPAPPPTDAH